MKFALTRKTAAVGRYLHELDSSLDSRPLMVLASFCMTSIVLASLGRAGKQRLFISYGLFGHIYPVFFLHITLLPINLFKLHRSQGGRMMHSA